jgi:prepilin peptidase CpaA
MTALLLIAAISALLCIAAWRDVATRLVPDSLSIAVAVLGLALQIGALGALPFGSIAAAAMVFVALLALCMCGVLGGADMKLAAALCLALPPAAVPGFIFVTTLAGGLMGVAYAARPRFTPTPGDSLVRRVLLAESRRLRRGGPLPYCIAIAVGGILSLVTVPGS